MKILWDLPYQAHTMFVEALTDSPHLQSVLHSRYDGFVQTLSKSSKTHVKVLFGLCRHDLRTITGSNIKYLQQQYNCLTQSDLFNSKVEISKKIVKEVKDDDMWKIELLEELINIREGVSEVNLLEEEIKELIHYVSTI